MKIFEESIDELATIVEEGARADFRNTKRFVEPAQGTLRRAQSRRHHIIFGRRGSGKSSLLFKSAEELTEKGYPIAFIDLEPFKGHQYPDIIISVLIAALAKIKLWLQDFDENERPNRKWYEFWKKKTTDKSEKIASLNDQIQKTLNELINQLHLSDDASLINKINDYTKKAESDRLKGASSTTDTIAPLGFSIEGEVANSREDFSSKEAQEEFKRSKRDYLLRKIIDFQGIFKELYSLTERDCFLFLDDLYHILRKDQASLIDYFHRISKGNKVWLKIGTIRTRTDWYQHTPQPMGLKLGDDADEINLDLTLEKFSLSKDFLRKILRVYIEEANAPKLEEFVADTGLDRLVLSSGGVARDFLGLFRKSITEARERLSKTKDHHRGEKIGAEDVNLASGDYGQLKKEEFQRDTLEDRKELEEAFDKIKIFCLNKIKKNVFLVDIDLSGSNFELLEELIDLRLIHQVKSRVTVGDRPGKVFKAFILDVSQYTGERARRDVEMVEFWKDSNKGKLRLASLIYDPNISFEELEKEVEPKKDKAIEKKPPSDSLDDRQGKLF